MFQNKLRRSVSLLAIAVGIKQKQVVNQIVQKVTVFFYADALCSKGNVFTITLLLQFLENKFVVMLFHYDGMVDEWKNLEWSSRVIHISAINQTKW